MDMVYHQQKAIAVLSNFKNAIIKKCDRTQNDHPSSLQKVIALCVPILSNSNFKV